jgi:hypothetical protein
MFSRCMLLRLAATLFCLCLAAEARPQDADQTRCEEVRDIRVPFRLRAVVRQLNSADADAADAAYCKLVGIRRAIPLLLGNAADHHAALTPYAGSAYINPLSSDALFTSPSQGIVSLYIVEATILRRTEQLRLTPHIEPELIHASITDQETLLQMAVPLYQIWFAVNRRAPFVDSAGSHPLEGSGIAWR